MVAERGTTAGKGIAIHGRFSDEGRTMGQAVQVGFRVCKATGAAGSRRRRASNGDTAAGQLEASQRPGDGWHQKRSRSSVGARWHRGLWRGGFRAVRLWSVASG